MDMFFILAPAISILMWSLFISTNSTMVVLISLLINTMLFPLMFVQEYKVFWPCGLIMVLVSTGLMVIFAYVVSLETTSSFKSTSYYVSMLVALITIMMYFKQEYLSTNSLMLMNMCGVSEIALSLELILLLLMLVVVFIRLVYSKGGGFRNKY